MKIRLLRRCYFANRAEIANESSSILVLHRLIRPTMCNEIPQFPNFSISLDGAVAILAYNRTASGNSLHPTVLKVMSLRTIYLCNCATTAAVILTGWLDNNSSPTGTP